MKKRKNKGINLKSVIVVTLCLALAAIFIPFGVNKVKADGDHWYGIQIDGFKNNAKLNVGAKITFSYDNSTYYDAYQPGDVKDIKDENGNVLNTMTADSYGYFYLDNPSDDAPVMLDFTLEDFEGKSAAMPTSWSDPSDNNEIYIKIEFNITNYTGYDVSIFEGFIDYAKGATFNANNTNPNPYCTIMLNKDTSHWQSIALNYTQYGEPGIVDEVNRNIYAYGDLDSDSDVDSDDIKKVSHWRCGKDILQ